ncbi:MAG: helix-turn-helix domain-containing protein [Bacteroidota bacterium]|nr:helix-turn-helix domain-containing protein [Bacteroidota bacterium]
MNEIIYTTDDISRMFHVGKSTIKRWTDEGKLKCFKTPGGHRKFRPANVHQFILQFHYEIATSLKPLLQNIPNNFLLQHDSNVLSLVEACYAGAIKGKHEIIEQIFSDLSSQGFSIANIFDDVLTPILRKIHTAQKEVKITSVEFQIAKNTLIHSLIHFVDNVPKSEKKNIELYCLSVNEGMNEVELKAVELLLENLGMTIYNLGTVLTKYAAHDIVDQCKPEDVFVVLSLDHSSDEIIQQFNALVSGVNLYGGNVYTSNFFEKEQTGIVITQPSHFYSFSEIVERLLKVEQSAIAISI